MGSPQVLDSFADLVTTIGSRRFGEEFYRLFDNTVGIEECTVFSFPAPDRPKRLVVEADTVEVRERALELATDYVAGGYRGDPNLTRIAAGERTAVYVAEPSAIPDAEFRHRYYEMADLGHELVLLGRADDTMYYSSFYRRRARTAFLPQDLAIVHSVANLVLKTLHRHHELARMLDERKPEAVAAPLQDAEQRRRTLEHMREVLLAGSHNLSRREAEVCAGIVLGYSTIAIGMNLDISPNTVATHRKRGYAKLGISSQNELFVRYFNTVRNFETISAH